MVTRQALPQKRIKTQPHYTSEPLQQHSHQLHLLNPIAEAEAPKLSIQLVPKEIALAPERYFLALDYEGHRWVYPIQLSGGEIQELIQQAQGLTLAEEGTK